MSGTYELKARWMLRAWLLAPGLFVLAACGGGSGGVAFPTPETSPTTPAPRTPGASQTVVLPTPGASSTPGGVATVTPTPTVTVPTVPCDAATLTYRVVVQDIANSDGRGRPGKEIRVFARDANPCVLRRKVQLLIFWADNMLPEKRTETSSYDLLEFPWADMLAALPTDRPVAGFRWTNSCSVNEAKIRIGVDFNSVFEALNLTPNCTPEDVLADTSLEVLPRDPALPPLPPLEVPIPAGFELYADVDFGTPTVDIVVKAEAPEDDRPCEQLFPWMIGPGVSNPTGRKVARCAFGGFGRPLLVAETAHPGVVYLWRTEILLPAKDGLSRIGSACEEMEYWMLESTVPPDSARYGGVCDALTWDSPPPGAREIWVNVFPQFVDLVQPNTPCWQLSAYLRTSAGEGRTEHVVCLY